MEKKVSQVPQGDQDHLVLRVPQEERLRTFLTQVHLEIRDLLVPMAQEEHPGLQASLGVLTS